MDHLASLKIVLQAEKFKNSYKLSFFFFLSPVTFFKKSYQNFFLIRIDLDVRVEDA